MGQRTVLYPQHVAANAKLVDFHGWDMPLHYGSQLEEHHAVRKEAGVFDVSHMTVVDVKGAGACDYLRYVLANDVAKLERAGMALYSVMLNADGGVLDDLIVYRLQESYRLVVNCGTRAKDLVWLEQHASGFDVHVAERPDLAILAIQGPEADWRMAAAVDPAVAGNVTALRRFTCLVHGEWLVARTGYTGEQGFEVILPGGEATRLWVRLLELGVEPVGLGARDSLRLEAGLNLYGQDMDEGTSPLETNLGWTVALAPASRTFIGREALEGSDGRRELTGLVLAGKGVLRRGQLVFAQESSTESTGSVTSGGFSPTLGRAIGLALMDRTGDRSACVEIRGRRHLVHRVKPPFVKGGKQAFTLPDG